MPESEERKFLHDIASPVGTAIFILDMVLDTMKKRTGTASEELLQIQQTFELLEQIKKTIEERREVLIQQRAVSTKPS